MLSERDPAEDVGGAFLGDLSLRGFVWRLDLFVRFQYPSPIGREQDPIRWGPGSAQMIPWSSEYISCK